VEVANRIEAGEREVEEEILKSPVMLDYVIRIGEQVEASDVDLREVFEENEEAEADEEKGPEAAEAQRERLLSFTRKLTKLREKLEETEEALRAKPGPRRRSNLDKQYGPLSPAMLLQQVFQFAVDHLLDLGRELHRLEFIFDPQLQPRIFTTTKGPPAAARASC
jgi:hypothetical protein